MKGRLLAFDPGYKRIGVATGNSTMGTTQALTPLPAKQGKPDPRQLEALVSEWRPEKLVVGCPLHMDGKESESSQLARKFARQLGQQFNLIVVLVDERLTSDAADALIRESANIGKSQSRRRKEWRDSVAAELILGTYINDNPDPL